MEGGKCGSYYLIDIEELSYEGEYFDLISMSLGKKESDGEG